MTLADTSFEKRTMRKIMWRILPLALLLYIVSYLDRVNLGYAALRMNHDLALSAEAFGFAAGVFFIGNLVFEVPSNVLMLRYGARRWIARIILTWGLVALLTAFVQNAMQLYVLRFLLGVAEAGFYPGIVLYFSFWFREKERALAVALFTSGVPLTYLFGGPLSTTIMQHVHWFGWAGWRWMIFLEALPALAGGLLCLLYLADTPANASWLTDEEKRWLASEFEAEKKHLPATGHGGIWRALANPLVWFLSLIYFLSQVGNLGISYWLPLIVKELSSSLTLSEIGLLSSIPYGIAAIAMVLWAKVSDRFGERRISSALPLGLGGVAMYIAASVDSPILGLVAICFAVSGVIAMKGPFFALPTQVVSRPELPVACALIVSIGNLGGFAGPYAVGVARTLTGATSAGVVVLSGALVLGGVLMLLVPRKPRADASVDENAIASAPK
jgi:MFS transporter, ACS family, tartrate transporter